jgi:hypothetical protein
MLSILDNDPEHEQHGFKACEEVARFSATLRTHA